MRVGALLLVLVALLSGGARARALPEHDPFTFVVYGDTREGGAVEQAIAQRIVGEAPDLVFHTGDFVRKGDDEQAWRDFFEHQKAVLEAAPFYPVFGNHEKWGDPLGENAARNFSVLREHKYYSVRVAGSAFIVLDGNVPDDAQQTAWLAAELARAADARHVFVFVHQPPFSLGDHCGASTSELAWVELFERFRVRAVFAGHDHAYERMERNGVRYFVSGGGGAPLYDERACAEVDRAAKKRYVQEFHYLRVRVAGEEVEVTAERVEPGRAIETVRFGAKDEFVAEGPPIRSERGVPQWALGAGGLIVLVVVARLLRRRQRGIGD